MPATIQPKDMTFTAVFEDDYGTPYTTVPTSTTSPSVTPDQFSGFTIRNYQSTLTVGYKSNLVFHTTIDAPYGYTIVWSNGQTGSRCEFNEVTDSSYIVSAKLVKDGVVVKEMTALDTMLLELVEQRGEALPRLGRYRDYSLKII